MTQPLVVTMGNLALDLLTEIRDLREIVQGLAGEVRLGGRLTDWAPLKIAAERGPFKQKTLIKMYTNEDIRGFRKPGRGRGEGELILNLASIDAYCKSQAGGDNDKTIQARAKDTLRRLKQA